MRDSSRRRRGIALVEVVVLGGLSLVAFGVGVHALHASQIFAKRARAENNLKALGLAMHNYNATYGVLPMSAVASEDPKQHGVGHSGFTAMLPFIEQAMVYNAYNFDHEPWAVVNNTATRTRLNEFLAPENKAIDPKRADQIKALDGKPFPGKNEFGPLHYGMNWGGGHAGFGDDFVKDKGKYRGVFMTVLDADGRKAGALNVGLAHITDGTSMTIAMVEKRDSAGWAIGGFGGSEFDVFRKPAYTGDEKQALQVFSGTVVEAGPRALVADGSVRGLSRDMERQVWFAVLTRNGGEVIKPFEFD